jgi:spore coat polysaccharide biosynthesis protein SpsF (cytidylyltransferase family)
MNKKEILMINVDEDDDFSEFSSLNKKLSKLQEKYELHQIIDLYDSDGVVLLVSKKE